MPVLLLAEHADTTLSNTTEKALTAAREIAPEVDVLIAGGSARQAAEAAARLDGVGKVLLAEAPHLANQLAEEIAALTVPLMAGYDALVAPSTARAKNTLPRVAALLDVMQVSDIVKVVAADTFERPIYAGNAIQIVRSRDPKKVVTVRTACFLRPRRGRAGRRRSRPSRRLRRSASRGSRRQKSRSSSGPSLRLPASSSPAAAACNRRELQEADRAAG